MLQSSQLCRFVRIMNPKSHEEGKGHKDTISRLPDDVFCHILSCLPTKDAVRTTILSSRWKYLWTLIYNLYFDNSLTLMKTRTENCRIRFVNFVDRVLILCQSKAIHDFHLRYSYLHEKDLSDVSAWVGFAINHNVHRLILSVHMRSDYIRSNTILRLPQTILTCKTLVELTLYNDVVLDIPDSVVCFPNLKLLHVHVEHPSGDLMKKLFASCPLLEDLTIDGHLYPLDDGQTFNIIVPTLKRLRIFVIVKHRLVSEHKFVFRAPNLEYLSIIVDSLAYSLVNEIPFLKEAFVSVGCYVMRQSFGISKDEANRAMELLRAIKNTKILSLPDGTMTALGFVYNENLPTFPNLIHLKLKIESCFGWKLLTPFLNNSPNLEVLILDLCEADKLYHHLLEDIIFEDFDWVEPKSVPRCLLSRVKMIKIIYMQGEDQQLEVVKYLLKNSVALETFSVGFWGSVTNLEKEILMFPRGSKTCTIEFL